MSDPIARLNAAREGRHARLSKRSHVIAVCVSIPLLALLMNWLWTPSTSTLGAIEAFLLWCVVAAVISVTIALMISMPQRPEPVVIDGRRIERDRPPTPDERRFTRSMYVSVVVLAPTLNLLFEPSTFGTLGGFFIWLLYAGVFLGGVFIIAISLLTMRSPP